MQIRCPHCQNPIEVIEQDLAHELSCPSCGSNFSLVGGDATTTHHRPTTRKLGHFELVEQLGMGAFGSVWKARDTKLDRVVAIKIPRKEQLAPQEAEQFLREARAAAQLRHPNIVSVHEVGRDGDTIYIVSDLVRGVTLADWLSGQKPTPREAAQICLQVAGALHHAHEHGVIHRDMKPGNIMLDADIQPHLMDFGLAKREAGEITMTLDGHVLGTPAYMSPEQARGDAHIVDRRTDIYSLGAILFQLLTGELPFHGTPRMLLHQVLNEEPRAPRSLNDRIPRDLETICLKAMAKEPNRRYQTAGLLAEDLKRYLEGEPILARPVGRIERSWRWCRRNPVVAGLSAAVVATSLVGTAVSSYFSIDAIAQKHQAEQQSHEALKQKQLATKKAHEALASAKIAGEAEVREKDRRIEAERQYRSATAFRLATQSREAYGSSPQRSLLLALEAVEVNRRHGERHIAAAEQVLRDTLDSFGRNLVLPHGGSVNSVTISPDGHWLATACSDKMVRLWDLQAKDPSAVPRTLTGHQKEVLVVKFSGDNRWLATAGFDETVRLWDLKAPDPATISLVLTGYKPDDDILDFSKDGRWSVTQADDQALRLLDLSTEEPLARPILLNGLEAPVNNITLSGNGRWLIATTVDSTVDSNVGPSKGKLRLWDLTTANVAETAPILTEELKDVGIPAISTDSRWLVVTDQNRIRLWNLETPVPASSLEMLEGRNDEKWMHIVKISPDSRWIAVASLGTEPVQIRLYDLHSKKRAVPAAIVEGKPDNLYLSLSFSPDSRSLLGLTLSQGVMIWGLTGDRPTSEQKQLAGLSLLMRSNWLSPDGQWLLAKHEDNSTRLCDLSAADPVATSVVLRAHDREIETLAWDPQHRWLVTTGGEESVRLWDLTEPHLTTTADVFQAERDMSPLAVSRSGKWLVASDGARVQLLDLDASNPAETTRMLKGEAKDLSHWTMSGDYRWLATANDDHSVQLWDLDSNAPELCTKLLRGNKDDIGSITLSLDARWVATSSVDKVVHVWDINKAESNAPLYTFPGQQSVSISRDGRWLVTSSDESGKSLTVWNLTLPDPAASPMFVPDPAKFGGIAQVSPDSRWLATFGGDDSMHLWDLRSADPLAKPFELAAHTGYGPEQFSGDGRWLLTARENELHLRDLHASDSFDSPLVLKCDDIQTIRPKKVSPDGRWLLSEQFGTSTIHLWDLQGKAESNKPRVLQTSPGSFSINWAFFSPNGRWLVNDTGNLPNIWDLEATDPELTRIALNDNAGLASGMVFGFGQPFTPDGHWRICKMEKQKIRRWNLRFEELIEAARKVVGRKLTIEERQLYAIPE